MNETNTTFYHFSLDYIPVNEKIIGMKYHKKQKQRIGQKIIDEFFEEIRKKEFPCFPSLFTSLWLTDEPDIKIMRKKFIDNPKINVGYLYEIIPGGPVFPVGSKAEIEACQMITFNKPVGITREKKQQIEYLARCFWTNAPRYIGDIQDYLSPEGGFIINIIKIKRSFII